VQHTQDQLCICQARLIMARVRIIPHARLRPGAHRHPPPLDAIATLRSRQKIIERPAACVVSRSALNLVSSAEYPIADLHTRKVPAEFADLLAPARYISRRLPPLFVAIQTRHLALPLPPQSYSFADHPLRQDPSSPRRLSDLPLRPTPPSSNLHASSHRRRAQGRKPQRWHSLSRATPICPPNMG
jgi:hypothetical protein